MTPREEFNKEFCHQVNTLGNGVRGLEMLLDYCGNDGRPIILRWTKHICHSLLERIPSDRVSSSLRDALCRESLLDADSPVKKPAKIAENAVVALFIDRHSRSGLVRTLSVEPVEPYSQTRGFPDEAEKDFCQALEAGCIEARDLLEGAGVLPLLRIPEDYIFSVEHGAFGQNPPLSGRSVWLAAALSYFSLWSGLQTGGKYAATGSLTPSGEEIDDPNGVAEKITACLRERPEVTKIIVLSTKPIPGPYGTDKRMVQVNSLDQAVEAVWGPDWNEKISPPALNVYAALDKAQYTYDKERNHEKALERFSLLGKFFDKNTQFPARYRFVCDWRMASCHTHIGTDAEAGKLLERWVPHLETLWQQDELRTEDYVNFFASYGVHLQDQFAFSQAVEVLEKVIAQTRDIRVYQLERAKLMGTFGQVLMFHHQFDRAEQELLTAYELIEDEEKPRECTYLGQLYILWRYYDKARTWLDKGLALNARLILPKRRSGNAIFNGVWRARLLYEQGQYDEAIAEADTVLALNPYVYPGCLAQKWRGLAHLAKGEHEDGLEFLRKSYTLSVDPQKTIAVVQETARIELLKHILDKQHTCSKDISEHVEALLKTLEVFSKTHPHFVHELHDELSQLQQYVNSGLSNDQLLSTLQSLTTKLVY